MNISTEDIKTQAASARCGDVEYNFLVSEVLPENLVDGFSRELRVGLFTQKVDSLKPHFTCRLTVADDGALNIAIIPVYGCCEDLQLKENRVALEKVLKLSMRLCRLMPSFKGASFPHVVETVSDLLRDVVEGDPVGSWGWL